MVYLMYSMNCWRKWERCKRGQLIFCCTTWGTIIKLLFQVDTDIKPKHFINKIVQVYWQQCFWHCIIFSILPPPPFYSLTLLHFNHFSLLYTDTLNISTHTITLNSRVCSFLSYETITFKLQRIELDFHSDKNFPPLTLTRTIVYLKQKNYANLRFFRKW